MLSTLILKTTLQVGYFYFRLIHDKTEKYRDDLLYQELLKFFRVWYWVPIFFAPYTLSFGVTDEMICVLCFSIQCTYNLLVLFSFNLYIISITKCIRLKHSLSLSTFLPWPEGGVSALLETGEEWLLVFPKTLHFKFSM